MISLIELKIFVRIFNEASSIFAVFAPCFLMLGCRIATMSKYAKERAETKIAVNAASYINKPIIIRNVKINRLNKCKQKEIKKPICLPSLSIFDINSEE